MTADFARIPNASLRIQTARPGNLPPPGDFVSVRVRERISPGSWRVTLGGSSFVAESDVPLSEGSVLRARVEQTAGRTVLRLLTEPAGLEAAFTRLGIPAEGSARLVAEVFMRNGQKLDPEAVRRTVKLLDRVKGDRVKAARLLSMLESKGIDLRHVRDETIESILNRLSGRERETLHSQDDVSVDPEGRNASHGGHQGEDREKRRDGRGDAGRSGEMSADDREAALLLPDGSGEPNMLQVFNHVRENARHWVILPFEFGPLETPEERVHGRMKLLLDDISRSAGIVTISVEDDSGEWHFNLVREGDGWTLSVFSPDPSGIERARTLLPAFEQRVSSLGIRIEKTIETQDRFDGFSRERGESRGGIDIVA